LSRHVQSTPLWEYDWLTEEHATVPSESPPRFEVVIWVEAASITVTIDDDCEVVSVGDETSA
jgi:hypothetical protein